MGFRLEFPKTSGLDRGRENKPCYAQMMSNRMSALHAPPLGKRRKIPKETIQGHAILWKDMKWAWCFWRRHTCTLISDPRPRLLAWQPLDRRPSSSMEPHTLGPGAWTLFWAQHVHKGKPADSLSLARISQSPGGWIPTF